MGHENQDLQPFDDALRLWDELKTAMQEQSVSAEILAQVEASIAAIKRMKEEDPVLAIYAERLSKEAAEESVSAEERAARIMMVGWLSELRSRRIHEQMRLVKLSRAGCECDGPGGCCEGCQ